MIRKQKVNKLKLLKIVKQRQIDENRAEYKQLLIEGQNPPPLNICIAVVHVENALT
jgi:hypothetical protein